MNYIELNREQKTRMKSTCNSNVSFAWEDDRILDILLGNLPLIRYRTRGNEHEINTLVWELEKYYKTYDVYKTDQSIFLKSLKEKIEKIRSIDPYWYGIDVFDVQRALKQHRSA